MSEPTQVASVASARQALEASGATPPLECVLCGLRCWNDESVRWYEPRWGFPPEGGYDREPFCVANGCAAQRERIERRATEQSKPSRPETGAQATPEADS